MNSWNEWGEQAAIEPSVQDGDALLKHTATRCAAFIAKSSKCRVPFHPPRSSRYTYVRTRRCAPEPSGTVINVGNSYWYHKKPYDLKPFLGILPSRCKSRRPASARRSCTLRAPPPGKEKKNKPLSCGRPVDRAIFRDEQSARKDKHDDFEF